MPVVSLVFLEGDKHLNGSTGIVGAAVWHLCCRKVPELNDGEGKAQLMRMSFSFHIHQPLSCFEISFTV